MRISTGGVLLAGAGGFLAYQLLRARSTANLVFFPGNIQSFNFVGATPVLSLDVLIQNSSSLDVTVQSLAGNVFSNGSLVGNVSNTLPIVVPANGSARPVLQIAFMPLGVVNTIIDAWQSGHFSVPLSFQGFANVGYIQVPLKLNFKIGS